MTPQEVHKTLGMFEVKRPPNEAASLLPLQGLSARFPTMTHCALVEEEPLDDV